MSVSTRAATCSESAGAVMQRCFPATQYDLAATLASGQAFRWRLLSGSWEGVLADRWVRLTPANGAIWAETCQLVSDWSWLIRYLQLELEIEPVLREFPQDAPMDAAVRACPGLRLLRQDPWECLASFILSSTKRIVQIKQIVALICERFGEPVTVPSGHPPAFAFPSPGRIAELDEQDLRACKMGFRAPYLKAAACKVLSGEVDLNALESLDVESARGRLLKIPGVGNKIADCVLLFAFGFQEAFPVDVWVAKALQELYFPKRRVHPKRLRAFSQTYFGRYAGYAQQYLFHYMRTHQGGERRRQSVKV